MICPTCKGAKIVEWPKDATYSHDTQRAMESGARMQCTGCGGTGTVADQIAETPEEAPTIPKVDGAGSGNE